MTKIKFENSPSTKTPINAENLNKLNNVVINSTEPTTGEEVWLQKGKNLFDKKNFGKISAYLDTNTSLVTSNIHNYLLFVPCSPNTTYTIQKMLSSVFGVGYTNELPTGGVQAYSIINDGTLTNATITTGANAKYIVFRYYHLGNDTTITEQQILDSIQIEQGSTATTYEPHIDKKIYTKNDNGGYEEFSNSKWGNLIEDTNTKNTSNTKLGVITDDGKMQHRTIENIISSYSLLKGAKLADYGNDLHQLPNNSIAEYYDGAKNIPDKTIFAGWGIVVMLGTEYYKTLIAFGNYDYQSHNIAIKSYVGSAWTNWRYI